MTLNQLESLNEQEINMMLYVVNVISHPGIPKIEFSPIHCTWFRDGVLNDKLLKALPSVNAEGRNTYLSLLNKLGVKVEQNVCPIQNEITNSCEPSTNTGIESQQT